MGFPPADSEDADEYMNARADADSVRLFEKTSAHLLEDTGTLSFATWHSVSHSLADHDFQSVLRQLHTPTVFLYGMADSPYTGQPVAEELCTMLPNRRSVAFARSGH